MSRAFDFCATRVLEEEGGEVNDPRDPGGHTNLGVTQKTLDRARSLHPELGLPASVSDLTRDQALTVYRALYWNPIRGDELPVGLALILFDCAINQGEGDAIRFLQRSVRVPADGEFGPLTMTAVNRENLGLLINEFAARRMYDYMQLDHLQTAFGLGWSRRLMRIHTQAMLANRGML